MKYKYYDFSSNRSITEAKKNTDPKNNGFGINDITTPGKLNIDILSKCVDNLQDDVFKDIALLNRGDKALIQQLMIYLNVSSHMQCVAFKK